MTSLIPFRRLTIKTPLSVQEAEDLLGSNVGKWNLFNRDFFGDTPDTPPFAGTVKNGRFNISNNIYHGQVTLFWPSILGKFHDHQNSTDIDIRIHLSYIQTILFSILLLTFALPLFLTLLTFAQSSTLETPQYLAVWSGFLIFLYVMTMRTFNHESDLAQYRLESLYSDDRENSPVPTLWRSINLGETPPIKELK